jgi:hypothetical protein
MMLMMNDPFGKKSVRTQRIFMLSLLRRRVCSGVCCHTTVHKGFYLSNL